MARVVAAVGHARLTLHGKRLLALSMYQKGKAFLGAALLLRRERGDEYVVLHLLCQGIEIVLKGLLLVIDYSTYKPRLKTIGHDLLKASDAAMGAAGLPPLRGPTRSELKTLNTLYSKHLLRYGSGHDILVDPSTIPSRRVLHRVGAVLRIVERRGLLRGPAT